MGMQHLLSPQQAQAAGPGAAHRDQAEEPGIRIRCCPPACPTCRAGLVPVTLQYIPHPASTPPKQGTSRCRGPGEQMIQQSRNISESNRCSRALFKSKMSTYFYIKIYVSYYYCSRKQPICTSLFIQAF